MCLRKTLSRGHLRGAEADTAGLKAGWATRVRPWVDANWYSAYQEISWLHVELGLQALTRSV